MNCKEFRIGNLISFKDYCWIKEIVAIDKNHIKIKSECGYEHSIAFNKLRTIKLDEEILLKFGFERALTSGNMTKTINGYEFGIDVFGNVDLDYMEYQNICRLEYAHELQNLYFALTKEELTFK